MVQSPSWEANRFSGSQEILILWNPNVHYRMHKCPPTLSILSQLDPVHASTSHFLKIHLIIIPPSTPGSLKYSFPPAITLYTPLLPYTCYVPRPSHSRFITRTILGEECKSLSSSLCSFLHSPIISSLLGPNILISTLFSNTLTQRSSLSVSDQVSHPFKTTDKIIILCIWIFIFLDSTLKYKLYSAPNDSKHSLTANCSLFVPESNFDLLSLFPNFLTVFTLSKELCLYTSRNLVSKIQSKVTNMLLTVTPMGILMSKKLKYLRGDDTM